MLSAYYVCCIYSNALQTNFIMKANSVNLAQTAPLSGSIHVHKQKEGQTTIVMNSRKRVKVTKILICCSIVCLI